MLGAMRTPRGFTLIELLVVVAILSILSLGAGLVFGGAFGPRQGASALAQDLTRAVAAARDGAIFGRVAWGLQPDAHGWQNVRRDADGVWQPQGDPVRVPGAALRWTIDGAAYAPATLAAEPPLRFLPRGRAIPFDVVLERGGNRVSCRYAPQEGMTCD